MSKKYSGEYGKTSSCPKFWLRAVEMNVPVVNVSKLSAVADRRHQAKNIYSTLTNPIRTCIFIPTHVAEHPKIGSFAQEIKVKYEMQFA